MGKEYMEVTKDNTYFGPFYAVFFLKSRGCPHFHKVTLSFITELLGKVSSL